MTLGELLTRMILEDDVPEEVGTQSDISSRSRMRSFAPAADDSARVVQALDEVTARLEAVEARTGLAVSGVEHSVREALARLDAAERERQAVAARVDAAETRFAHLDPGAGPRSEEAVRALTAARASLEAIDPDRMAETVLARLADRLAAAEHRTGEALQDLTASMAALDARLNVIERSGSAGIERRFKSLAEEATRQVEEARADVAQRLEAAGAADIEARFAEMTAAVRAAERRAADVVERMGNEVLRMAEAVGSRLTATEDRSAEAIDLVGVEIARVAGAVEARLARGEQAQAEALERLGAEVGRITERFTDRLSAAERRSAEAIQGVGDQVARLTERLEQRHDRNAGDLAERIRQNEVRTAAMLDTAIPRRPLAEAAAEPAGPFGPELFSRAEPAEAEPLAVPPAAPQPFSSEDFQAADGFAPIPESEDDIFAAEPIDEPDDETRPLSTREVIDQARAAARAAQGAPALDLSAKVEAKAASGGFFNGFGQPRPRRRANSALHTALMVAGGAAFLSVGAAGVVLMDGPDSSSQQAQLSPFGATPRAAVALAPGLTAPPATPARVPPNDPQANSALTEAIAAISAGKPGGLTDLKALADQGYAPAQLRLAHLYETGEAGVVQNLAEARKWTALAAEGGAVQAMHNLGVYFFRGEGGPKDLAAAAQWFRKAAAQGLPESQYNLGLMYQAGSGVTKDLAEARRWFDLAAAQGDKQAERAAEALQPAITAQTGQISVTAAKQILERLGYYDGPMDPQVSPDFRGALAQYQHDQGRAPTGELDPGTAGLLAVYQR